MDSKKTEWKPDYKLYKSRKVSIEMLDKLMDNVASSKSVIERVASGLKIFLFFGYLWARKRLIDEDLLIKKQEYEQKRNQQNESDIESDDLD